ncbi:MAG: protein kinase domain-containing protein [Gammaproteobacteria bacterium]
MNIPGYTVLQEISRGGMGVVYLAIQKALERQVALKVLPAAPARNSAFRKAFLDEGKVVAKLTHQNIIALYDLGHTADGYYISMEYIPGKNLEERIREGLLLKDSVHVIVQLAQALGYAHRHGVVHRDIKPTNVLFRDDRSLVLTDFGIAKLQGEGILLHSGDALIGTPSYVPPERVKGEPEDARSDLYSLGALFYEMLLGIPPYVGEDAKATALKHVHEPIPELPEILAFLQPILNRLLAKDPGERFRDTYEFVEALEGIVSARFVDGEDLLRKLGDQVALLFKPTQGWADRSLVPQIFDKAQDLGDKAQDLGDGLPPAGARARRTLRSRRVLGRLGWVAAGALAVTVWHYGLAPRSWYPLDPQAEHVLQQLLAYEGTQPVESLLGQADAESRYATYTFALAVLQGHPRVMEGLKEVAARFETLARQQWRRGQIEQALLLVRQGLHFQPDHAGLATLERYMRGKVWEKQRAQIMTKLIAQAKGHMQEARLIESKGDNAFDTYNAVLMLDRDNREAREGLTRIRQRLTEDAERARQTGDLERSLALIDEGLRVDPKGHGLHTLKDAVAGDKRALGKKHRRLVAQWLERAQRQFQLGRLTTPPGDNAFETYRMLLAVVPRQADALAGLEQIAERCMQLAEAARGPGKVEASLALIDQGLQAVPGHGRLAELRTTLGSGQAETIRGLLGKAEQQLVASRLTAPKGDNALETYRQILALDPGNAAGRDGLDTIARHYHALAQDRQRGGDLQAAQSFVDEGLKVQPEDGRLLTLKKTIETTLTAQAAAH